MKTTDPYYIGIDLHSNNLVAAVVDATGDRIKQQRIPCDLYAVDKFLHPFHERVETIAVESTFNWYWLVDGLQAMNYNVVLANPAKNIQYSGKKNADDKHDAFWLADLLRLGILESGYICPIAWRATRDLLRRRRLLVRHRTSLILSARSLQMRNFGLCEVSGEALKRVPTQTYVDLFEDCSDKMTADTQKTLIDALSAQISRIERQVMPHARQLPGYELLLTIPGFGKILAMTIAMEIVSIERFSSAEHFASYARMVPAIKKSNNRKKGDNNRRCGNRYLGWAFIEAANIHCRFSDVAKRWHDRKKAKTCKAVAVKALGCKLAKAVWHVLHEQVPYDESRVFGPQKTNSKAV